MSIVYDMEFDEILEQLIKLIELRSDDKLKMFLDDIHARDISEMLLELDDDEQDYIFGLLDYEKASEVLEEIDPETFYQLVMALSEDKKIVILDAMGSDDIVDMLRELPEDMQREIISSLDIEGAKDIQELLVYDEDTAGGIMTKDFVVISENMSIYQAFDNLRETAPSAETIYYVFVSDEDGHLTGVLSLRELIVAKPNQRVHEIMSENVISVNITDDQEEVARVVSKYDLLAVPVVDDSGIMMGIVTVDDILDVIEEEATEDILKIAGSSELEDIEEEKTLKRIYFSVRSRLPWLIITIFGGFLSASVVKHFQGVINSDATLALFMTMLAGMGGNVGTQSSTLTVRSIAMGYEEGLDALKTVFEEMTIGLFVGFICAFMAGMVAIIVGGNPVIGIIVGVAMWANMFTAATIGTIVPLSFKKMGFDPAVASAPFITTVVDITGLTIYFTLSTILMQKML